MTGLIWLTIGMIAAAIAKAKIRNSRWFGVLLFGLIGAFIGGSVYGLLIQGALIHSSGMLPIGSVITAALGAAVGLWGYATYKR